MTGLNEWSTEDHCSLLTMILIVIADGLNRYFCMKTIYKCS